MVSLGRGSALSVPTPYDANKPHGLVFGYHGSNDTRVFVNGQSFGGLMTDVIGCQRGDTIRAIAVVAGSNPSNK